MCIFVNEIIKLLTHLFKRKKKPFKSPCLVDNKFYILNLTIFCQQRKSDVRILDIVLSLRILKYSLIYFSTLFSKLGYQCFSKVYFISNFLAL